MYREQNVYSAYQGFGKAKLVKMCNGGLVLGSSQFPLLPQLPQKNDAHFKIIQNRL